MDAIKNIPQQTTSTESITQQMDHLILAGDRLGLGDVTAFMKEATVTKLQERIDRLEKHLKQAHKIMHDQTVANQAAWIEWQHGRGAEAGMQWIENGLRGPGHIPQDSEPYGKESQAYFDANRCDPMPECICGRPSNQLWMDYGACCDAHMETIKGRVKQGRPVKHEQPDLL